jgi:hypothetical protein
MIKIAFVLSTTFVFSFKLSPKASKNVNLNPMFTSTSNNVDLPLYWTKFDKIFRLFCAGIVLTAPLTVNADFQSMPYLLISDYAMAPVTSSTIIKLPSGIEYYDPIVGKGDEVKEGSSVQFQWVLRRSNGYFVDSSSNYDKQPFIYRVGNMNKVIKGLDEGIRGMKVGGVRRINIPSKLAYIEGVGDDKPGPMPAGYGPRRQILSRLDKEVWFFEIQLTKLKN